MNEPYVIHITFPLPRIFTILCGIIMVLVSLALLSAVPFMKDLTSSTVLAALAIFNAALFSLFTYLACNSGEGRQPLAVMTEEGVSLRMPFRLKMCFTPWGDISSYERKGAYLILYKQALSKRERNCVLWRQFISPQKNVLFLDTSRMDKPPTEILGAMKRLAPSYVEQCTD